MATLADFFDGKVDQQEYSQSVAVIAGEGRYTADVKTQRFTFVAVPSDLAHSESEITVTDIDERQYTFTPKGSFSDASTGYAVFATEEVKVTRARLSYHLWTLTVERTGRRLYLDGEIKFNGPSWAFPTT